MYDYIHIYKLKLNKKYLRVYKDNPISHLCWTLICNIFWGLQYPNHKKGIWLNIVENIIYLDNFLPNSIFSNKFKLTFNNFHICYPTWKLISWLREREGQNPNCVLKFKGIILAARDAKCGPFNYPRNGHKELKEI